VGLMRCYTGVPEADADMKPPTSAYHISRGHCVGDLGVTCRQRVSHPRETNMAISRDAKANGQVWWGCVVLPLH